MSLFMPHIGRWTRKGNFRHLIRFNTVVRGVKYDEEKDTFIVSVYDQVAKQTLPTEVFDFIMHCIDVFRQICVF